jgi:hypothetical protein
VNHRTAQSLEQAITESISLQPFVKFVRVSIDRKMLEGHDNVFGYNELQGKMLRAEVEIEYEGVAVRALLEYDHEKSYPLMRLI